MFVGVGEVEGVQRARGGILIGGAGVVGEFQAGCLMLWVVVDVEVATLGEAVVGRGPGGGVRVGDVVVNVGEAGGCYMPGQ